MFDKNLGIPKILLQSEALEGRVPDNFLKLSDIKAKIRILRSGYNGEKVINHHIGQIPYQKYHIFHDIRLPIGTTFFQIDAILLSPNLILMLEGKNHSGTLRFEENQMIQEYLDTREIYENPISQVNRHKILLKYWLEKYHVSSIPIESFVVVTKSSTEIIIRPGYSEAEEKVCKANDLLTKIVSLEVNFKKEYLNPTEIEKVRELFLRNHTPQRIDILKMFGVDESDIIAGVRCPNCSFIPMNYNRKIWICPMCQFISKDAFLKAIDDYFLIKKTTITNADLRNFLLLPSSRSTTYLLSSLKLPYTGTSRDRVYHLPQSFPLYANHVFPNKTNTIKNKNRGNMDEKITLHP